MSLDRIRRLVERWREEVEAHAPEPVAPALEPLASIELLESMLIARHLDLAAHELRATGDGHYTICSTGHECNAVLGRLTRTDDPALLHYRSAALFVERARQIEGVDAAYDIALSLVASNEEPTSGGRHKVFGSRELGIVPQTSTIASHLPRAVGMAFALERRPRLGLEPRGPDDSIVIASFGDASINHSTALGAFNAAGWVVHQNLKLPLVFVCEDNGLGISVRSPPGWVEARLRALPHVQYFAADGWDPVDTWRAAEQAVDHARKRRRPSVLHLRCVRLLGHAGSDADAAYRPAAEILEAEARDPVLRSALYAIDGGILDTESALELESKIAERVARAAAKAKSRPKISSRGEVMESIARAPDETVVDEAARGLSEATSPLTLAQGINAALSETLTRYPESLVFGEDVAKKGGVYGVTKGLLNEAGPTRVFNTLLDEQTILGLALGTSTMGMLPSPEIQYLAYVHNAEDQLRGEAATLPFFSNGAYDNPMVVRIAGLAYQKGFGGHFHNDNSIGVFRDIPGLVVAVPARADDAMEIFRTAFALAKVARRVVVIVEPIALYHTRDLHEDGDNRWLTAPLPQAAPFARARVYHGGGPHLTIATYGNGLRLSLRAAKRLEAEHGIGARVLDLRWLAPLPIDDVVRHAGLTGTLLLVDECRANGGVSEALAAALLDRGLRPRFARVTAADSFIPLGDAAEHVLVSEDEIIDAAVRLVEVPKSSKGAHPEE